MKFVDFNFVSDEDANRILESYGYETVAAKEQEEEVVEESEESSEGVYLYEHEGILFSLCEDVEVIDDLPYIQVIPLSEEDMTGLDESNASLLESVDVDGTELVLGDVFEDENSGEVFVALEIASE